MFSRRLFLQSAAAAAALTERLAAARLQTIGVQLYTVRNVLPKQPAETLKAIAGIGYQEIEATYAGLDSIWPAIQSSGLKPVSIHLDSEMVMNPAKEEDLKRAIEQVKKWGFTYAVFPYVPPAQRGRIDQLQKLVEQLNKAGEKCYQAGLTFCYHNHAFEFEAVKGATPFQVLQDDLNPKRCQFEIDCFWVSVAGHDPVELLNSLKGRVPLIHLKDKPADMPVMYKESVDRTTFKEVGSGSIPWKAVLGAAQAAGVKHYFVEQDQTPGDPIDSLRSSFDYLSKLQY
jgi:sugar phosphate isomerase/epimerase